MAFSPEPRRAGSGWNYWFLTAGEAARLAVDSLRREMLRSALAVLGIVIGIVTVVLVASVLANVRNQIALLFRELGTDNVFASDQEAEAALRRLRGLEPGRPNDFNLSTSDQIIRQFDRVSLVIWLITLTLAAVSLVIGSIGVANVMIIGVTERTREIGIRLALGARRGDVRNQFLAEAALLSCLGGMVGVVVAGVLGAAVTLVAGDFSAVPPAWSVSAGLVASLLVGVAAGYLPARRASRLDPVEALRYE